MTERAFKITLKGLLCVFCLQAGQYMIAMGQNEIYPSFGISDFDQNNVNMYIGFIRNLRFYSQELIPEIIAATTAEDKVSIIDGSITEAVSSWKDMLLSNIELYPYQYGESDVFDAFDWELINVDVVERGFQIPGFPGVVNERLREILQEHVLLFQATKDFTSRFETVKNDSALLFQNDVMTELQERADELIDYFFNLIEVVVGRELTQQEIEIVQRDLTAAEEEV